MGTLPSTTYQSPPRQARGRLNTIMEEREDSSSQGTKSDSDGDVSDNTIIGRPAGWNPKLFVAAPRKTSRLSTSIDASPIPSDASPCSSTGEGFHRNGARSSYTGSEVGTIFSDDSVPSLASDPTTFATDSSRNSIASTKSGRSRYPALLIPRGSWQSMDSPIKEIALGMSPVAKIALSPAMYTSLARNPPSENGTPSLGSSSIASESPCIPSISGPGTPDMNQLENEGEGWGQGPISHVHNPLEIAIDEDQSIVLSPAEAHGPLSAVPPSPGVLTSMLSRPPTASLVPMLSPREQEWGDMVTNFPRVPGVMPRQGASPFPDFPRAVNQRQQSTDSGNGVHLPLDALKTLERLTREVSPDEISETSRLDRLREEMRERSVPSIGSRPRSLEGITPATESSFSKLSDYSFTQLSIPSPGGFFSSLQTGARHTWCLPPSRQASVPTSAVAENFYSTFPDPSAVKETVLGIAEDTNATEGPPTARQALFDPAITLDRRGSNNTSEDQDMYGATGEGIFQIPEKFEYEEAYAEEINQTAEANLDRTTSWLSAQTSYLSALRGNNPINSPADYLSSPHPFLSEQTKSRTASMDSNIQRTVRFLEEAKAVASPMPDVAVESPCQTSPDSDSPNKETIFLEAFRNLTHDRKKLDAFLHSTSRLQAVRSDRIALPERHLNNVSGQHVMTAPKRPKYSGPFNHNPRATGVFERTADQLKFEACEREQRAMQSVQQASWQIDALKAIYGGRLLASPSACDRLAKKATLSLSDPACVGSKRLRILDMGGEASASWAWHAAAKWPNVKVYTVITKHQASLQRPAGEAKPQGPDNHRVVSVPHLWQLPFRTNHFDVISARGLHALLKNNPVPGVPEIDEWDLTLKECMRILKPGGYLDFMVMDSGIAKPGQKGENMSVEFGFELHRRGYEREAARSWLRRLRNEGFVGTKRAWMFWPMGRKEEDHGEDFLPAPRPVSEVSTISKIVKQYMDVEAVQGPVGSTQDVADVTGLLGARMWEEWVVKVRREQGRESGRLLEGLDEVLEEGKRQGAGWKVLVGWARKPKVQKEKKGKIEVKLDSDADCTPVQSPNSEKSEMGMVEMGHIPLMIQG